MKNMKHEQVKNRNGYHEHKAIWKALLCHWHTHTCTHTHAQANAPAQANACARLQTQSSQHSQRTVTADEASDLANDTIVMCVGIGAVGASVTTLSPPIELSARRFDHPLVVPSLMYTRNMYVAVGSKGTSSVDGKIWRKRVVCVCVCVCVCVNA